ncbi:uncharacterized protein LOC114957958 isoform X3 [Acropora millepora]|uniref:uncharacterized protein LOC114957958 isoform X3 n=1 Tax=Acropora millepora TaxID=45264 RepID=UPI001CF18DEA|nr:uncharacterized protein LOC114957958 isoform X3 [Acropora millepora]
MGQDNTVKHCNLNYHLYILKVIAFLLVFGFHLEAADPARKLCLDNQFIVVYADGSTRCEDCGPCPAGQQHSHVCGGHIYPNASLVCELCPENTFSSHEDTSRCVPCSSCAEDQVVLQRCTATQDVVCDKKCSSHDRYFDESGVCLPCSKCCGDGRDKVENECKFKLGGALENACAFNQSGNHCDISTSNPTTATSNSTKMTGDTTSTLNVTSSRTLPLASGDLFPSTSVPGRSTSGLTPERIFIIVVGVLLSIIFVTLFVKARGKCNHLHGANSDVEIGQPKTETIATVAETGEAFGSRKDTAWEEDEEERRGSKEPLLRKHGKLLQGAYCSCQKEKKAEKVSKPLGDLYNDSSDILKKVRESLDTPIRGLGSVEDVAKHYLFDVVTVRSRFQTSPDGPSDALISAIIAQFPDETVESFARVVVMQTRRQNVAKLLREFDRK